MARAAQDSVYQFTTNRIHVSDPSLGYEYDEVIEGIILFDVYDAPLDLSSIPQIGWACVSTFETNSITAQKQLISQSVYKNRQLHGPQRQFYRQIEKEGEVCSECWYKDGVCHGRFFVWHPETQNLIIDIPYKNGLKNGTSRYWYPDGTQRGEVHFQTGVFHGTMKTYHPTRGTLVRSQSWNNGQRHGIDVLYHGDEGFLLFCEEWNNGKKKTVFLEDLLEKNLHAQVSKTASKPRPKKIT